MILVVCPLRACGNRGLPSSIIKLFAPSSVQNDFTCSVGGVSGKKSMSVLVPVVGTGLLTVFGPLFCFKAPPSFVGNRCSSPSTMHVPLYKPSLSASLQNSLHTAYPTTDCTFSTCPLSPGRNACSVPGSHSTFIFVGKPRTLVVFVEVLFFFFFLTTGVSTFGCSAFGVTFVTFAFFGTVLLVVVVLFFVVLVALDAGAATTTVLFATTGATVVVFTTTAVVVFLVALFAIPIFVLLLFNVAFDAVTVVELPPTVLFSIGTAPVVAFVELPNDSYISTLISAANA